MKTIRPITWTRTFSAGGPIEIPAGAPVEWHPKNKCYYIAPRYFSGSIEHHDAVHYGCRVEPDNVDHGIPPENPTPVQWKEYGVPGIEALINKGYKYVVLFKEGDVRYGDPLAFKEVKDISDFMQKYPNMKMIWQRTIQDQYAILTDRPHSTCREYND